jgi:excisionase family DNA binding protein
MNATLLRIPEVAERLHVSRASVYRWIEEGRLPAVQLGGRGSPLRILEGELEAWLYSGRLRIPASELESEHVSDDGLRQEQLRPAQPPLSAAGPEESRQSSRWRPRGRSTA